MLNEQKELKRNVKNISCQNSLTTIGKDTNAGITLVALVVTVVVLLILAGVTIMYVLGDNSILKKASESKEKMEVAKYREMLETAKTPIMIEGLGNFDVDKYFEALKIQGIIEKDVVDNEDGTYEVTTKPGYVFDVTLVPNKENPTDAEIEYAGKLGNLRPRIAALKITDKEETSATIEVTVIRFKQGEENGTITGTCTPMGGTASDITLTPSSSTEKTQTFTSNITGLTKGTNYTIEITINNDKGNDKKSIHVIPSVKATGISLNAEFGVVTGGGSWKKSLELKATVEPADADQTVTWTSEKTAIATVNSKGVVTGTANGKGGNVKIVATTSDGRLTAECDVRVEMFGAIDNSKNTTYTDNSSQETHKEVTIPKGYAVGTSDNINKIDGGLVIQDIDGNQFVWVPVDETAYSKMIDETNKRGKLYDFKKDPNTPITYSSTGYREPDSLTASGCDNTTTNFTNTGITGATNAATFKTKLQGEFDRMANSVKVNHGFFIGRYETGNLAANSTNVPVIQRGIMPGVNVNWYYMYAQGQRIAKNENVTSSMIWGCQWDRTMDWIVARNGGDYSLVTNSTNWGNHAGTTFDYNDTDGNKKEKTANIVVPTGSSERNKQNNVYDLAGNVYDYTLEANRTDSRVYRRWSRW